MSKKESRPSPTQSATLFKVGTVKKGNDGNLWIIDQNKNGTKRWKKQQDSKSKSKSKSNSKSPKTPKLKIEGDKIVEFELRKTTPFKKIGEFDIGTTVVIGEMYYTPKKGFPKFKKGKYYIYKIDDSLLLSKNKIDKDDIKGVLWKNTGHGVGVDGGTFGFWDLKYLEALGEYDKSLPKNKRRPYSTGIPYYRRIWNKSNLGDTLFIKIKNLENAKLYIEGGFDGEQVIGVVGSTGTGDGSFSCYADPKNNMLLLLGGFTALDFYESVESNDLPGNLNVIKKYNSRKKASKKTSKKSSKTKNRKNSRSTSKSRSKRGNKRGSKSRSKRGSKRKTSSKRKNISKTRRSVTKRYKKNSKTLSKRGSKRGSKRK